MPRYKVDDKVYNLPDDKVSQEHGCNCGVKQYGIQLGSLFIGLSINEASCRKADR
jgi:hypothetical protein